MSAPSPSRQEPSIRTLLAANRAQQSAVLPQLFSLISSLSAPSSSSASANTSLQISRLYTQLATLDEELAVLTERARKHAEKWERMERLKTECVAVEREVRRRAIKLQKGRRELEQLLSEGKETVKRIDLAAERPLLPTDLLSYASTLAPYTSAPPSFNPAQQPPGAFFPPFPTEHIMRRGRLNAGGALEVVGQTSEVKDTTPTDLSASAQQAFAHPLLVQKPKATQEIFDFDLNSDLED